MFLLLLVYEHLAGAGPWRAIKGRGVSRVITRRRIIHIPEAATHRSLKMMTVVVQVIVNSTIQTAVPMTQLVEKGIDDTNVEENNFGKRWTMRLKEKDERTRRILVATVSVRATIRR